MTEFGIFTDEGLIEAGFFTRSDAQKKADEYAQAGESVQVDELCREHPLYAKTFL